MTFTTFIAVSIITDRFNNLSDSTICINPMTSLCFIYVKIFIICVHLAKLVRTFLMMFFQQEGSEWTYEQLSSPGPKPRKENIFWTATFNIDQMPGNKID